MPNLEPGDHSLHLFLFISPWLLGAMANGPVRPIVIDDSDNAIRYSGVGWFRDNGSQDGIGNFGPTYLRTLHGTNVNGGITYTFNGTSVQVWGTTKLAKAADGTFDPSWECFVDKISIGATKPFEFPENNWLLCEQNGLDDRSHEIAVNINAINHTFYFDKIQYTPSPSTSLETAVVLVDNHDPGISFDSSWRALGGTANMTQAKGSTATFLFTGTSVSWIGFIPTELPHNASSATYSVDGGPPTFFELTGLPPSSATIYNQEFFKTPELQPGPHSLVVIHQGTGQQTPLTLDFLYVTNTSTPASQSTGSNPNTISSSTTSGTPTPLPTPLPDNNNTPVGVIVGGVLGGLALIALTLLILWWYKRGQRRDEVRQDFSASAIPPHLEVSPFTYNSSTPGSFVPEMIYGTSASPSMQSDLRPQRRVPVTGPYSPSLSPATTTAPEALESQSAFSSSRHGPSASTSSGTTSGYNLGTVLETREMRKPQERPLEPLRRAIVHEDSGLRLGRDNVIDIPPTYTPD